MTGRSRGILPQAQPSAKTASERPIGLGWPRTCEINDRDAAVSRAAAPIREQEAKVAQVLLLIATYWLFAAFWLDFGWEPRWVWMAMLPFAWLGTLGLLRD